MLQPMVNASNMVIPLTESRTIDHDTNASAQFSFDQLSSGRQDFVKPGPGHFEPGYCRFGSGKSSAGMHPDQGLGLYVHVPFCLCKCHYCDFISYPYDPKKAVDRKRVRLYLSALSKEIKLCAEQEKKEVFKSLYIGGGTPTCLSISELAGILEEVDRHFCLHPAAEITVEVNPGTVDLEKLQALYLAGVNRLSIGVQSFADHLLEFLGRIHSSAQGVETFTQARRAGFDNINLDLIFGIPGQGLEEWKETLQRAVVLEPEHIAAYSLQIEEETPLFRAVCEGKVEPCPEELELAMYRETIDYLTASGYIHYEISNFARSGCESRHNLIYWLNGEYIGLGPAAHSHRDGCRYSNLENVESYALTLARGNRPLASWEALPKETEMAETVFMGLRLLKGLDTAGFAERFGVAIEEVYGFEIDRLTKAGLLERSGNYLRLTPRGLPVANEVFASFV